MLSGLLCRYEHEKVRSGDSRLVLRVGMIMKVKCILPCLPLMREVARLARDEGRERIRGVYGTSFRRTISPSVSFADSSLAEGAIDRSKSKSIVVFPADLKRFARRKSREVCVMALARLFERSEFRSHMEQISGDSLANLSLEAAFFGSFLWQQRNEHKKKKEK